MGGDKTHCGHVLVIAKCGSAIGLFQCEEPDVGNKAGTKGGEIYGLAGVLIPALVQINSVIYHRFCSLIVSVTDTTTKKTYYKKNSKEYRFNHTASSTFYGCTNHPVTGAALFDRTSAFFSLRLFHLTLIAFTH
jgi:hypothetical protein